MISPPESNISAGSILSSDSICIEVPTDDIRVGDMVLVLPGETIPVDVSLINYQVTLFNSIFLCKVTVSFHQEVSLYILI